MRIAIVTESFLPHMNGVTGSVLHVLRHLEQRGDTAIVIAPHMEGVPAEMHGAPVLTVPSVPLPRYRSVQVATATTNRIVRMLRDFAPDVVHLASPFALGWRGVLAAQRLGIACVAIYQTDIAAYAGRYRVGTTRRMVEAHIARLHRRATITLAPSGDSEQQLHELGVDRIRRWTRGVDAERFHPSRRSGLWRDLFGADTVIGYVGRLAAEKQVADLRVLNGIHNTRLVIVGDGPERERLEERLPGALFLGQRSGNELADIAASFDIFVHPGESETFGQTLQEAHASGVPVVATGAGGPRDLVRSSVDGWLYRPGDLGDLRERVMDLVGDPAKRRAFGLAGRAAVEGRSWDAVCARLCEHYREAIRLHAADRHAAVRRAQRPEPPVPATPRWNSYVALGDSQTEGLWDPGPNGQLRGWADRTARLLAARTDLRYANLAVRSRRVRDVAGEQLTRARQLRPDLVSIFVGANDLVRLRVNVRALAAQLEEAVSTLRADGADVLLVTPVLPDHRAARIFHRRIAAFSSHLAGIAGRHGAMLLDMDLHPELGELENWSPDLVHLSSRGHRFLAYRAGELLGVPLASELQQLDAAFHDQAPTMSRDWWAAHALPWMWRRLRGRTAGDGLLAKHSDYELIGRTAVFARSADQRPGQRRPMPR